jgi:hypothetical protein
MKKICKVALTYETLSELLQLSNLDIEIDYVEITDENIIELTICGESLPASRSVSLHYERILDHVADVIVTPSVTLTKILPSVSSQ